MDLRCPTRLQAVLHEDGVLEVRCKNNRCGHAPGVVVIHRFNIKTGDLIDTKRYRDPTYHREEEAHGADGSCVPLRSS